MNQNVMRRLLLIKVTEIVEVTETITILIENDVLKTGKSSGYGSPAAAEVFTDVPVSNWVQLEFYETLLSGSAVDLITP